MPRMSRKKRIIVQRVSIFRKRISYNLNRPSCSTSNMAIIIIHEDIRIINRNSNIVQLLYTKMSYSDWHCFVRTFQSRETYMYLNKIFHGLKKQCLSLRFPITKLVFFIIKKFSLSKLNVHCLLSIVYNKTNFGGFYNQ